MKKLLYVLLVLGCALIPVEVWLCWLMLARVVTPILYPLPDLPRAEESRARSVIGPSSMRRVQIWSEAGSVATVAVEGRISPEAPWIPLFTVTNPTTTGELWAVPDGPEIRVETTAYASGVIHSSVTP